MWAWTVLNCLRRALVAVGLLLGTVTVAQAGACQMPSELVQLARHLGPATGRGALSGREIERLQSVLDGLSERALVQSLDENGLSALTPTMFALVTEANKLVTGEGEVKGWYVAQLLRTLESESVVACQEASGTGYQVVQQEREGGTLTRDKDKPLDWGKIEKSLQDNRPLSLGVLVGAVLFVVGALFGVDFLVRVSMAMIYNRKACRIPASLRVGKMAVTGAVVTLGRGGFRFQPDTPQDLDLMLGDHEQAHVSLMVEDLALDAILSRNHGEVADFRFDTNLGLGTQKTMLRLSKISPYTVRKTRGAPKPQAEILEDVDFQAEAAELDLTEDPAEAQATEQPAQ